MLARLRPHLTYANVVSTLCLFILLGGSAYAASTIGSKQIKNNSVQGKDIKNGSVTGSDVKKKSLTAGLFKAGQLKAGPAGATGAAGARGPQGPQGPAAATAFAAVSKGGTLAYGNGATAATNYLGQPGNYLVTFNRSVVGCALLATQGYGRPGVTGDSATRGASASVNIFNDDSVFVQTSNAAGTASSDSFFVVALC